MYKDSFVLPATDVPDKWVRKVSIWIFIASIASTYKTHPAVAIILLSDMFSIDEVDV